MKKFTILIGLIMLFGLSHSFADDLEVEAQSSTSIEMRTNMTAADEKAMADMTQEERNEYLAEKKAEFDALSEEEKAAKKEEMEAKKEELLENKEEREEYRETMTELRSEAKEMREERKAARQEFVAAAKANLTARIEAKGARLSQIPQDKLNNAAERIEEMIVKYEENEKLSDEIKDVILDQLYALQEMIEVEIEVEVETEVE